MKFEQFTEEMRQLFKNEIGIGYKVQVKTIIKNNACQLTGLLIHKIGENAGPVVYMEPYYKEFLEGRRLEQLVKELVQDYQNHRDNMTAQCSNDFMRQLLTWDQAKDLILYKVVNARKNNESLEKMPHREYLDLAIVYYLYFEKNDSEQYTVPISIDHMKLWRVTENDLYREARENTPLILPAVVKTGEDFFGEMIKGQFDNVIDDEILDEIFADVLDTPIFYICTNHMGMNGASCMLYEGLLAEFAEKQDCDVVILPSSIHEVLLIPDRGDTDYGEMRKMVADINESDVPEEDVLSDQVYRYSVAKGEIEIA